MFEAVEIEINSHCDKACSYCPNSQFERIEKGFMQVELFDKIVGQLKDLNFNGRVSFSFYNEPLLNKNLVEYVRKLKKNLPQTFIEIYTNGSMLNNSLIEVLFTAGVDKLSITEHEDVNDNKIKQLVGNLKTDIKSKISLKKYTELKLTNRGGLLPHLGDGNDLKLLPCKIPEKVVTITVKGNVLPCFEDFFQKNIMGNIENDNLKNIWNSKKYQEYRKNLKSGLRHKYETCINCSRVEAL